MDKLKHFAARFRKRPKPGPLLFSSIGKHQLTLLYHENQIPLEECTYTKDVIHWSEVPFRELDTALKKAEALELTGIDNMFNTPKLDDSGKTAKFTRKGSSSKDQYDLDYNPMKFHDVNIVNREIARLFSTDTPYVVSGAAAFQIHKCHAERPDTTQIEVLCAKQDIPKLMRRARRKGAYTCPEAENIFGILVQGKSKDSLSQLRAVHLIPVPLGWEYLLLISRPPRNGHPGVLTLQTMADLLADKLTVGFKLGKMINLGPIIEQLRWVLEAIGRVTTPDDYDINGFPHLRDEAFLQPIHTHDRAFIELLANAGVAESQDAFKELQKSLSGAGDDGDDDNKYERPHQKSPTQQDMPAERSTGSPVEEQVMSVLYCTNPDRRTALE